MPIYVDSRGKGESIISEILDNKNYPVEVTHLESADYCIGELGIERKTVGDLIGSVRSKQKGHNLWDQLKVMKDTYKKCILILEGYVDWSDRLLAGIIYGILDGWQIPIIFSQSYHTTADHIGKLYDRYGAAKTAKIPIAVKKGYTPKQIRWMMLQTIPHIGGIVAKRIVDDIPDIFSDGTWDTELLDGTVMKDYIIKKLNKIQGLRKDSKEMLLKVLGNE